MANHKSAIKRIRQNEKRRLQNRSRRTQMRSVCKKFEKAVASGDVAAATTLFQEAAQTLDKAVSWGVVHKNGAARKKSRFSKRLLNLKQAQAGGATA